MDFNVFVKNLYQNAVDKKDVEYLAAFLDKDVYFKIGNHDAIKGKSEALQANELFFKTIHSMTHQIDNIWIDGEAIICNGRVSYVRLNESHYQVPFCTVLRVINNKITEYLVYADLSEL